MMAPAEDTSTMPIAIIGMACIFPQAPDLATFWNNVLRGVDAIGEPVEHWEARRYLEAGRIKTQFGGFLKDLYRFDPREFGIMPNSVDGGETDQYLALRVARDALIDAGYLGADEANRDTGIVLGHSAYLHRGQVTVIQQNTVLDQTVDLLRIALPHADEAALAELRQMLSKKLPPTTADNAPGLVPNMMTGRIANRLNLRGPNYVLDAACASSLLSVAAAIDELRTGRSRMMLAGGVNATLPADVSTSFTQLGALSARGRVRPFEEGSDGTLLGEGLGVVVLKRLADAIADGDRVYAVIRGVGQSSDGKGAGLLAPSHEGETLAMRRAYAATGVDPASIGLVEAHGTGIPLGDKTEIASLHSVFGDRPGPWGTKALGSVKSMISHCIPAAGIASLIKMSLALHHRVLPPTLCDKVNPELGVERTPFYVNTKVAPWLSRPSQPRRAAVNSFGFGGINAHAIVEQAPPEARAPGRLTEWPAELCVFSADTPAALAERLEAVAAGLARNPGWRLGEVAAALARQVGDGEHRLALVAADTAALGKAIGQALTRLRKGSDAPWSTRGGVSYSNRRADGQLAFLFPGEGSQYMGMFADLAPCFPEMQRWLDFWHGLHGLPDGQTRTDIVFPSSEVSSEQRAALEQRLHDMDVGSEAVFIGGMAMNELLSALGVAADVMMGHSSGESAALGACGANTASSPEALSACISQHFAIYDRLSREGRIPTGALMAVGALPPATVEEQLAIHGTDVMVAMDNCANQLVLYGAPEGIARVQKALTSLGGICMPLPFDRGYHTPVFADVSQAFLGYYKDIKLGRPKVPLYSCASVGLFPDNVPAVRRLAAAQWSQKVRFRETVLKMHDDGVRIFLEVGPSANLTAFVNDILIDREYLALSSNVRRRGGLEQLLSTLGQLFVAGRPPRLERLFEGRAIAEIDLAGTRVVKQPPLLDNTMPKLRFDAKDRERLQRLLAPAPVAGQPAPAPAPEAAAPVASLPPPVASPPPAVPVQDLVAESDPGQGARDQVMAEYFDLMRGFLQHQTHLLQGSLPQASADAAPAPVSTHVRSGHAPLLDRIVSQDASAVHAQSTVGLLNDRFVRHHVLSGPVADRSTGVYGLACIPFMASLEFMAEACALLAGSVEVTAIEHVKAFDWVALDDGELDIDVHASVVDREAGHYAARIVTPRGTAMTAEFRFDRQWRLGPVAPLKAPRPWNIDVPHLYTHGRYGMFHGPVFHSLQSIDGWNDEGIDVSLTPCTLDGFFERGQPASLVLNPVLLDAMGQVVPCWLVHYVGPEFHSFPSTIERIEFYEPCPADRAGIRMQARQRPDDPTATQVAAPRQWTFDCTDGEGRVLLRCEGFVNLFFQVTPSYHSSRTHPLGGLLGAQVPGSSVDDVLLWQVPMLPEDLSTQSGGICLRIMAHVILTATEREEWRALRGSLRHRREWLFGRAALKEATRVWAHRQTGEWLYLTDIEVLHDEWGAPHVDGAWNGALIEAPRVSLSHSGEVCLAAVSAPDLPVGVDLEEPARLSRPDLVAGSFAPSEQAWLQGLAGEGHADRVARLWCAKEAAAKCLGIGLQGQPEAFVVAAGDPACDRLLVSSDWGSVDVRIESHKGTIIAVGLPESARVQALVD